MNHQVIGLCLIVLFVCIGMLTYPHVRRLCQPRTQAE